MCLGIGLLYTFPNDWNGTLTNLLIECNKITKRLEITETGVKSIGSQNHITRCNGNPTFAANDLLHTEQVCGLSPVWLRS